MGLRNARVMILMPAVAGWFSACSCYSLKSPKDGDVVKLPAKTMVVIDASPSMSALAVKLDGSDVTNQITWTAPPGQGELAAPAGNHTLTADADLPCWYCSGQKSHYSAKANFCVAGPWPSGTSTRTALARGDNKSWDKTSDATVGFATDAGQSRTQWNMVRVGGIGQSLGMIQSTENTCLCMASTDAQPNAPIGLAFCDPNNQLVLWESFVIPNKSNHSRFQNVGRGISEACLTEGANGVLIQSGCNDTDQQLWRIRENPSGNIVSPF
jgi:hypothetical protein